MDILKIMELGARAWKRQKMLEKIRKVMKTWKGEQVEGRGEQEGGTGKHRKGNSGQKQTLMP